jgi:hypothetical protein
LGYGCKNHAISKFINAINEPNPEAPVLEATSLQVYDLAFSKAPSLL